MSRSLSDVGQEQAHYFQYKWHNILYGEEYALAQALTRQYNRHAHVIDVNRNNSAPLPPPEFVYWTTLTSMSAVMGFSIGALIRARETGLQFTAENSHRKPTTQKGWYLYHRNKNYAIGWGAIRGGMAYALKFGGFLGAFFAGDVALDLMRGGVVEWWHGAASGTVCGIAFALTSKFYALRLLHNIKHLQNAYLDPWPYERLE